MPKHTDEFKLTVVMDYLSRRSGGPKKIAKKYGINHSTVLEWTGQYQRNGFFFEKNKRYSVEFKLKVLNYQQEHHLSDLRTALMFEIPGKGLIAAWRKKYIAGGEEALQARQGRKPKVPRPKSRIPKKPREEWSEHEELEYLRMENAYLKKLYALIREREQEEKKDATTREPSEN